MTEALRKYVTAVELDIHVGLLKQEQGVYDYIACLWPQRDLPYLASIGEDVPCLNGNLIYRGWLISMGDISSEEKGGGVNGMRGEERRKDWEERREGKL